MAKVSEKRLLEWWEAPGIDGREAFDEEILYLNSLVEELELPRWALAVRDLMPRWGFEPCAYLFPAGLEQVLTMIGQGKAFPRLGGCGEISLAARATLKRWGEGLLRWSRGGELDGQFRRADLGPPDPERAEAARAAGEVALALLRGHAALDEALERWAARARHPFTRTLVEGEQAPLAQLFRHACCFNLQANLARVLDGIASLSLPEIRVCSASLREAEELDSGRIALLRLTAAALVNWQRGKEPASGWEAYVYGLLGPRDRVREWLVASLYKCLKLWLQYLDRLTGARHRYPSLV